jgi:7,8-dihydropterin-6-yl-methyl-4-(beta-D-ribofuranosyl)aminobenzene 5'-phosphate synthase
MIKKIIIIILFVLLFRLVSYAGEITVTVTYNNVPFDQSLITAWGISCFIKGLEKTILFDTGGDGSILLNNMKKLKIDPEDIDIVVLSHIHGDHVGGLWTVLENNDQITVYLPETFPKSFKDRARKICKEVIPVGQPVKICKDVWSTGQMGNWVKEQSLIIDTEEGLVVITGCAHPGIVSIVQRAKQLFKKEIYLVLGGFHLLAYDDGQVKGIIRQLKELRVKKIAPSHCTGGRAIELFRQAWGEDFFDLGCGAQVAVP